MNSQKLLLKLKEIKIDIIDVKPVFLNTSLYSDLETYLINQKYLKFNKIKKIINLEFSTEKPIGYIMKDKKGKIVGFLGSIFFFRNFNNIQTECCYIHTWIVEERYRIFAYKLILPIIEKNLYISTFTPITNLVGLYKKLDFQIFKMNYRAVFSYNFKIKRKNNLSIEIINKNNLTKENYKIFKDHQNVDIENILFKDKRDSAKKCFIMGRKIFKKKIIPFFNLIYVSNREIFKQHREEILYFLKKKHKILFFGEYYINRQQSYLDKLNLIQLIKKNDICFKNKKDKYLFDCLYSELLID